MTTNARGTVRAALLVCLLAATAGCATAEAPTTTPSSSCLPLGRGNAQIDWVPFVVVDEQMYATSYDNPVDILSEDQVGDVVATVSCRIADVGDPDFEPRDGDAAYLPAGTSLHEVRGREPEAALAALEEGTWRLFTAVDG